MEPWSTIGSVRGSSAFLRDFTADGWTVAGFCRTLPYVGTPMERRLREEGRLIGPSLEADYQFLDPRLDLLWDFSQVAFEGRNFGPHATWNLLRGLLFDTHFDLPGHRRDPARDEAARAIVRASNTVMLDVLDAALDLIEDNTVTTLEDADLLDLARVARSEDRDIRRQLAEFDRTTSDETYEALFR
jgi:anaerobic magnesium-protoporphyrin IX monomethyl ester cyclase